MFVHKAEGANFNCVRSIFPHKAWNLVCLLELDTRRCACSTKFRIVSEQYSEFEPSIKKATTNLLNKMLIPDNSTESGRLHTCASPIEKCTDTGCLPTGASANLRVYGHVFMYVCTLRPQRKPEGPWRCIRVCVGSVPRENQGVRGRM